MSKAKGRAGDARRDQRRRSQFAALQERASSEPAAGGRREHIHAVDITGQEQKYEPFLLAIESGLVEAYRDRDKLPVDDEAERALRLVITRFEGDSSQRSGSPDVDALADRITRNVESFFRRHPLLSRAEIVGCLRRVISSIHFHHAPANPRAYLDYIGDVIAEMDQAAEPAPTSSRSPSGLWTPGQGLPSSQPEAPRRPGGIWLPGDT